MIVKPAVAQRLEGRVAIVTGGGGNPSIGRSICLRYAEEGAKVAVLDVDRTGAEAVVAEITSGGGAASAHHCDVTDETAVETAVDSVAEAWGDGSTSWSIAPLGTKGWAAGGPSTNGPKSNGTG